MRRLLTKYDKVKTYWKQTWKFVFGAIKMCWKEYFPNLLESALCHQIFVFWDRDLKFRLQLRFWSPLKKCSCIWSMLTFWINLMGSKKHSWSQNLKFVTQKTQILAWWCLDFTWDLTWNMQFLTFKCQVGLNLTPLSLWVSKNMDVAKISCIYLKKHRFWKNGTWILPEIAILAFKMST